jgi:PAS domain S-box-containing protein/putative nucleotidyltransferase with HDIG domain
MGIMRDITERKRMEEIVKLSEQYFKGVFDSANDAILIFSPENEVVIDVNPQACKMYGFTRDEFEGISLEKISQNISHGKLQIEETIKKGIFHDFETVQYRKNGSEIFLEINASVLDINDKKVILSINRDITERKRLEQELQTSLKKAGNSLEGFIRAISVILEKKDPHTSGHHRRVANLSYAIAKKLGLSDDQAEGIKTAALVHDIGKIDIPVEILTKPSKLNDYEFNIIKTHPRAAYEILKNIEFPWRIAEIVYQHHEKFNGSGYPIGLRGDDIMLEARIIMIANVVEAITAPRAYRPSLGIEKALEEITLNREKFYDPTVVYACLYLFNQEDYKLQ